MIQVKQPRNQLPEMWVSPPRSCLSVAERARAYRRRRREGLHWLPIELRNSEIDALIRKQLLKPETRKDPNAVIDALYVFLDRTLDT